MFLYSKTETMPENIRIFRVTEAGSCEPHRHEFIELIYIRDGSCIQTIDGAEYRAERGDLLFVSYDQTHSFSAVNEMTYVNILLEPSFLSAELMDTESILKLFNHSMFSEFDPTPALPVQCVRFCGGELAEMDHLIAMMEDEYTQKKQGYRSLLHGCVRILITMLLRNLNSAESERKNSAIAPDIMPDILSFIDENCNGRLSLEEIAARSFYNPAYFGRLLKKYCGKSFSAYLKERRMRRAADLLRSSRQTIEAVMAQVGYNDKKLFYRHFREIFGTSPGKFRDDA